MELHKTDQEREAQRVPAVRTGRMARLVEWGGTVVRAALGATLLRQSEATVEPAAAFSGVAEMEETRTQKGVTAVTEGLAAPAVPASLADLAA